MNDKETNGLLQIGCSPGKLWKTEEAHRKENPRKHQCMEGSLLSLPGKASLAEWIDFSTSSGCLVVTQLFVQLHLAQAKTKHLFP